MSGTASQLMATYSSGLEVIEPLQGSQASVDGIATGVVSAAYSEVKTSWTAGGDGSAALANSTTLARLYADSYSNTLASLRRRAARHLHQTTVRSVDDLMPLFQAVATVRASGACASS